MLNRVLMNSCGRHDGDDANVTVSMAISTSMKVMLMKVAVLEVRGICG